MRTLRETINDTKLEEMLVAPQDLKNCFAVGPQHHALADGNSGRRAYRTVCRNAFRKKMESRDIRWVGDVHSVDRVVQWIICHSAGRKSHAGHGRNAGGYIDGQRRAGIKIRIEPTEAPRVPRPQMTERFACGRIDR
jgi:hypothetical protein